MRGYGKIYLLFLTFCTLSSSVSAQDESVWNFSIDSISVRSHRYTSPVRSSTDGVIQWRTDGLNRLPQILGNTDPVHYAQMLPGIQTNSETRSGINIEGCDSHHSLISMDGIPVYNVCHLMGIFSAFNSDHFPAMTISRGSVSAASPNRLGGQLDMHHPTELPDSLNASFSVGLISSQGTVRIPIGQHTALNVSLRGSYMNLLYGRWLRSGEQQFKYLFYDANLSFMHKLDLRNTLFVDIYSGSDSGNFVERHQLLNLKANWGNHLLAAHWIHNDGDEFAVKTSAYFTTYRNRVGLDVHSVKYALPSNIADIGVKSDLTIKEFIAGGEIVWHNVQPQMIETNGGYNTAGKQAAKQSAVEMSVYGGYEHTFANVLALSGGVRGSVLAQRGSVYWAADPSLRLKYDNNVWQLTLSYALRHQYLFQTGFSDCGLPTEFWLVADSRQKPQYTHELSLGGGALLANGRIKVSAELFWRKLYNQIGYKGSILDFVNTSYDIYASLMHGKGENRGVSMMVSKNTGHFTGWLSYTYTQARRRFDETGHDKLFAASHERPHELTAVATYALNAHWDFSGTFVYASGNPFTAVESLYLINDNIIMKYGEYNGARLRPYMRLDLSANFRWAGRRTTHALNISLYNVTSRNNELFYYLSQRGDAFAYKPQSLVSYILPSLSYNIKF